MVQPTQTREVEPAPGNGMTEDDEFLDEDKIEEPSAEGELIRLPAFVISCAGKFGQPHFPAGQLSELRRLNFRDPDGEAFLRLLIEAERRCGIDTDREIVRMKLAAILCGVAKMTRPGPGPLELNSAHVSDMPVGRALYQGASGPATAQAFISDGRFVQFLRARHNSLLSIATMIFNQCASGGVRFNWYEMASLLWYAGYIPNLEKHYRSSIARAYYRAESMAQWAEKS